MGLELELGWILLEGREGRESLEARESLEGRESLEAREGGAEVLMNC